jgi:hypothetical protein
MNDHSSLSRPGTFTMGNVRIDVLLLWSPVEREPGGWDWQAAIDGQGGQEEGDASKAGFEIGGPKVAVTRV